MCCTYRLLLDIKARGWLVSWCQIFIGIETSVTLRLGVVESVLDMGSSQIGNTLRSGYIEIECHVVLVEHCCLLGTRFAWNQKECRVSSCANSIHGIKDAVSISI